MKYSPRTENERISTKEKVSLNSGPLGPRYDSPVPIRDISKQSWIDKKSF